MADPEEEDTDETGPSTGDASTTTGVVVRATCERGLEAHPRQRPRCDLVAAMPERLEDLHATDRAVVAYLDPQYDRAVGEPDTRGETLALHVGDLRRQP